MKHILHSVALLLISSVCGIAQNNLTFKVNMSGETISPDGVHVMGNWQIADGNSTNWDPAANLMGELDQGVYTYTATNIPDGVSYYNTSDLWRSKCRRR